MKIWIVGIALAVMVAAPARLLACSCAGLMTEEEAFDRADAVFTGRVVRVRTVRDTTGWARRAVTFAVGRWEKGGEGGTVVVRTGMGGGDCGFEFHKRRTYRVFAGRRVDGELGTGICSGTMHLPDEPQPSARNDREDVACAREKGSADSAGGGIGVRSALVWLGMMISFVRGWG
jgi:hypothetical protein